MHLDVERSNSTNLQKEDGRARNFNWRNINKSIKSKIRMYKTFVRPVMTFRMKQKNQNESTTAKILVILNV